MSNTPIRFTNLFGFSLCFLSSQCFAQGEITTITEFYRQTEPYADIRYRFEHADVGSPSTLDTAKASTVRSRLGFKTPYLYGFSVGFDAEDISVVGDDNYNSGTNANTQYVTILDPADTEINQAYMDYKIADTVFRYGRQRVEFDNGRFLGDVNWRQNQQTYDALMIMNRSFEGSRITYAYMTNANRFLGEENPNGNLDMDSHFVNYNYSQLNGNQFSAYAYLLEMQRTDLVSRSQQAYGLRYKGTFDISNLILLYTAEIADQANYKNGSENIDAQYWLLELGVTFPNQWIASLGQETLTGDGVYGFQTPLATLTNFNGYADIFARATPTNGLEDNFLKLSIPAYGIRFNINAHQFSANNTSDDYGQELDVSIVKKFKKHFSVGFMYASYSADTFATDLDKLSFWVDIKF